MRIVWDGVERDATPEEQAAIEAQRAGYRPVRLLPNLSPRQFNLMLLQIGLTWNDIQSKIDAMKDTQTRAVADVEFNRAGYFKRDHWLVKELAVVMGLSDIELDTMWSYAADL